MYTEILGSSIKLSNNNLHTFSKLPFLIDEQLEYDFITNKLCMVADETRLSRRIFIVVDNKNALKPSCWLSFQFLKNRGPEVLIANMRSCSIEIFGSDLGFVCRLALILATDINNVECIWNIGSLHSGDNT